MKSFAQRLGPSPLRFPPTRTNSDKSSHRKNAYVEKPASSIGFNFAKLPLHAPAEHVVQAKLEADSAADVHEREADRAADEVMATTTHAPRTGRAAGASNQLTQVQLSPTESSTTHAAPSIDLQSALQAPGNSLEPQTRSFMEARFGHDFSKVRVHTDSAAASSARNLNARAYTVGHNIVFAGEYTSAAVHGGYLLAHELAHVVQQRGSEAVVQCSPDRGAVRQPAKSPTTKSGTRMSSLRAKSAEVQGKLQGFAAFKEWRGQFHASTAEKLRDIEALSKRWSEIEQEWQESQKGWHIFEHESNPWIEKRINQLYDQISKAYWDTMNASDAEKKYESDSRKQEAGLLTEQRAIIAAIGKLDQVGKEPAQSELDSLMARLNKLSAAVDQLTDAEMRAQAKYTGSAPVSRAR